MRQKVPASIPLILKIPLAESILKNIPRQFSCVSNVHARRLLGAAPTECTKERRTGMRE